MGPDDPRGKLQHIYLMVIFQSTLSIPPTFLSDSTNIWLRHPVQIKEAERYFCAGAQHLSLELIKLFILYLARTAAGKLDKKIISKTTRDYISHTLCAAYRSSGGKKQLDIIDLLQVYTYINQLERKGELSNKTRVKPIATKNNLDILIAIVFSNAFALKLSRVKLILNLALYINLYMDSCSRDSNLD